MPYSTTTFANLKQQLADRLDNPNGVFWTDAERGIAIQDAIRFWNILTGDFKVWYDLAISGHTGYGLGGFGLGGFGVGSGSISGIWYDLQRVVGSPRACFLTDADLYSRIQYQLLEQQLPNAALSTNQFQTADLVNAVQGKRDEFLFRTGCTSSIELLNVLPNTQTVQLPQSVIQARRAYWLPAPQASPTYPAPLPRTDEAQQLGYDYLSPVTNSVDPESFSAGVEPQLTIDLYPPPGFPGQVELITYESQGALDPANPSILYLPQDFVPGLMWGALSDLMDTNMVGRDAQRAEYARGRFEQYIELMSVYPFILAARNEGVPMQVDAVEVLDVYDPQWRVVSSTPSVAGLSGENLLAFPSLENQLLGLYLVTNANVPVDDGDFVQLGEEVLDAIIDYSAHTCMFKQGWSEVESSMGMMKSIVELAAHRNAKIRALSTFKELLYGRAQRENELAQMEIEANG